jgi:hypothetical protein
MFSFTMGKNRGRETERGRGERGGERKWGVRGRYMERREQKGWTEMGRGRETERGEMGRQREARRGRQIIFL